jgi:hypothetical protein
LNYPTPTTFRCLEKVFNAEAFEILTKLNPINNGYSKINDCLHPTNIDDLKRLKTFVRKEGHNVDYSKSVSGRGRYTPNNMNKSDNALFQGMYNKARRILVNGNLKAIDLTNAHIEIIKNICRFLKLPPNYYPVLTEYCENRNKIFDDAIKSFQCDRKQIKEFFIIQLFGGDYITWLTNNKLEGKKDLITPFMTNFIKAFDLIKNRNKYVGCYERF